MSDGKNQPLSGARDPITLRHPHYVSDPVALIGAQPGASQLTLCAVSSLISQNYLYYTEQMFECQASVLAENKHPLYQVRIHLTACIRVNNVRG